MHSQFWSGPHITTTTKVVTRSAQKTYCSIEVVFELVVKSGYTFAKSLKFWNNQIISKNLDEQRQISRQDIFKLVKIQIQSFQTDIGLGLVLVHDINDIFQPFVREWFDSSSFDLLLRYFKISFNFFKQLATYIEKKSHGCSIVIFIFAQSKKHRFKLVPNKIRIKFIFRSFLTARFWLLLCCCSFV